MDCEKVEKLFLDNQDTMKRIGLNNKNSRFMYQNLNLHMLNEFGVPKEDRETFFYCLVKLGYIELSEVKNERVEYGEGTRVKIIKQEYYRRTDKGL